MVPLGGNQGTTAAVILSKHLWADNIRRRWDLSLAVRPYEGGASQCLLCGKANCIELHIIKRCRSHPARSHKGQTRTSEIILAPSVVIICIIIRVYIHFVVRMFLPRDTRTNGYFVLLLSYLSIVSSTEAVHIYMIAGIRPLLLYYVLVI